MATTFWHWMDYNFDCMIASDTLFDSRGWLFGAKLSDEDIVNFEVLRDVAMATVLGFLYPGWGCTLAQRGKYDTTVDVRRRCGLLSNTLTTCSIITTIITPQRRITYVDAANCYRPSSMVCRSVALSE